MTEDDKRGLRVGIDLAKLREVRARDLVIRFAFGAAISVAAALVGLRFGHRAGGLFLAFPAILPASLTLISDKHGRHQATVDAIGAVLGGLALGVFALAALVLLGHAAPAAALLGATAAWLVASAILYFGVALALARSGRDPSAPDRSRSLLRRREAE